MQPCRSPAIKPCSADTPSILAQSMSRKLRQLRCTLNKVSIRRKMRILAAGGDGTVAWILKTIRDLALDPEPHVAVMPLGTGNDLSLSFGWGNTFLKSWINVRPLTISYNSHTHLAKIIHCPLAVTTSS